MELEKNLYFHKFINKSLIIFIAVCLLYFFINITYANQNQIVPNLIITINTDGSISNNGSLFSNNFWYPGRDESGIIRINNNYKNVRITGMGLNVTLNEYQPYYGEEAVMKSFLNNMKLTVKNGKFLSFDNTIVDEVKFSDLLNNNMDDIFEGFILEYPDSFNIRKSASLDLKYTMYMDKGAGAETQSLSANVEFIIDFDE